MRRINSLGSAMRGALAIAIPSLVIFVGLVASGQLSLIWATLTFVITLVAGTFYLRPFIYNGRQTERFIRRLVDGEAAEIPRFLPSVPESGYYLTLSQLRRRWLERDQELLRHSESFTELIEQFPEAVLVIGAQGRIVTVNDNAKALLHNDLVDRQITSVIRDPDFLGAYEDVMADKEPVVLELTIGGDIQRHMACYVKPITTSILQEASVLVTLHDITARKRSEQMRADFVANASHEIKTPLAAVNGFIETLLGPAREDPVAQERFLSMMGEQTKRMKQLIEDLLSLSRIELNEHTQPTGRVELVDLLESVHAGLQWRADEKKITVDILTPEEEAEVYVRGEMLELEQVFQNLVDNALKYGAENSRVTVTLSHSVMPYAGNDAMPMVAISVEDQGMGIAAEHLPRLTERFYRVDPGRSRKMGGTGLGLAIVKHIINRHQGRLMIDSTVGQGSTFTVYLPTLDQP